MKYDMKIGIMGGTFDPIHIGHLVAAEEARAVFGLDKVIFVPNYQPPHKPDVKVSHPEHRYAMVLLSIYTNPHFEVSRVEIERGGPSYAIDTVKEFKKLYPEAEIYFITGADAIAEILSWKQGEEILKLCKFIAVTRPGYDIEKVKEKLSGVANDVQFLKITEINISSTEIRRRVREGKPIKYLVLETVENYIYKHNLYSGG
ncbi:nicotinate-nucleotide adenylyltransferase [bacterium]|nr:nicotinate-nucleotide adenylyltransferase [bacterium]